MKDNQPKQAFPGQNMYGFDSGMDLRDYFAATMHLDMGYVVTQMKANGYLEPITHQAVLEYACKLRYLYADLMMKQRQKVVSVE